MKMRMMTTGILLLAAVLMVTGCNSSATNYPAPRKRIEAAMENVDDLSIPNESVKFANIRSNKPLEDGTILLMIAPEDFEEVLESQLPKIESIVRRVLQMRESYAQYHEDFARLDADKAVFEKEKAALEEERAEFERKKKEFETRTKTSG
jgi:hypothetical protein